jgi:hypothetical protein
MPFWRIALAPTLHRRPRPAPADAQGSPRHSRPRPHYTKPGGDEQQMFGGVLPSRIAAPSLPKPTCQNVIPEIRPPAKRGQPAPARTRAAPSMNRGEGQNQIQANVLAYIAAKTSGAAISTLRGGTVLPWLGMTLAPYSWTPCAPVSALKPSPDCLAF